MSTSPDQLLLLADHIKLSLLERQRAITLNLEPNKQDGHITRSLESLRSGIEGLQEDSRLQRGLGEDTADLASDIERLQSQYTDLSSQFTSTTPNTSSILTKPNNPSLSSDFTAATTTPRSSKSVRFRDNPNAPSSPDALEASNRAALFPSSYRDDPSAATYSDEPAPPDQTNLSNQQIHDYHKNVLRDQDEQLDRLGESVGRQRILGIQMGNELDEHVGMLEDMEAGVDRHQSGLDRGMRGIKTVSRKARDNWTWVTIGILILILVLLIVIL